MFSDRIQYNAPIPGEEFKKRDLSVPSEAAKVVYEIDSQHGEEKDLCITILARTFRGSEAVTKILHECAQNFRSQITDNTAWQFQATVNRNVRVATIEGRMAAIADDLKNLKADIRSASKKKEKVIKKFPRDRHQIPITPARVLEYDEFVDEDDIFTPKQLRKLKKVEGNLEEVEGKM